MEYVIYLLHVAQNGTYLYLAEKSKFEVSDDVEILETFNGENYKDAINHAINWYYNWDSPIKDMAE